MSEFDDTTDEEIEPQENRNPLRSRIKDLESEIKSLRQVAAEAEQTKRESAMLKAGVNPDDPAARYFVKAYDGELSVDAIKQAAVEARLLSAPTPDPEVVSEQNAWNRINRAAVGSQDVLATIDLETRIRNAGSEAEIMAILAEAQQTL